LRKTEEAMMSNQMLNEEKRLSKKEKEILELYKFYKKIFGERKQLIQETLEDKIERVNPYYTRNRSINYVAE
jgi:hypothetical protein